MLLRTFSIASFNGTYYHNSDTTPTPQLKRRIFIENELMSFREHLQFALKVRSFDVKVEQTRIVDEDGERTRRQRILVLHLPQHLVQDAAVVV